LKARCKPVLIAFLVSLISVSILAGCGGPSVSSVVGVYIGGPPSPLVPPFAGVVYPPQTLELKANGTFEHIAYIPGNPMYKGTFAVKNKQVILHGEPPEAHGTFKIVGRNLSNHWGLWVRQSEKKK
jgi:hypothetical protein